MKYWVLAEADAVANVDTEETL